MLNAFFVLVFCVLLLYYVGYRWYKNRYILQPPVFPGGLPLLGHAHMLVGDSRHMWIFINRVLDHFSRNNKDIATLNLIVMDIHVIMNPDDFLTVSNNFLDKAYLYELGKPWLGDGMITCSGAIAKRSHKLLGPAFNLQVLNDYLEVFNSQSRNLIQSFAGEVNKGAFNPTNILGRCAIETVCLTSMGIDSGDWDVQKDVYLRAVQEIQNILVERFTRIWLHPHFIFKMSSIKKEHDRLVTLTNDMILKLIRTKRSHRNKNKYRNDAIASPRFRSLLDILLEMSDSVHVLTDKEIKDEVETMMVAGHETTAYTLVFILMLLGSYQDVQQKAYEESIAVLGDTDRDVGKDDLPKLEYLEAVIKEVIRLYPVVPVIGRHVDRDFKLREYTIKAGATCVLPVYGMQRHPMWGLDADQFRPERWLDKASLPQHPAAYPAFSLGKRSCIGKTYSMLSMKTTLSHLLRHYHVTADHTQLVLKVNVALKPESGQLITIRHRNKKTKLY